MISRLDRRRMRVALALTLLLALASSVTSGAEDLELRDLDVADWDCLDRAKGTAETRDGIERNRMKNRPPDNHTARPVESLDVATFLKKVGANVTESLVTSMSRQR
jgi:hypothetical protein